MVPRATRSINKPAPASAATSTVGQSVTPSLSYCSTSVKFYGLTKITIFAARRYANTACAMAVCHSVRLSVCPFVRPSQAGVLSKRLPKHITQTTPHTHVHCESKKERCQKLLPVTLPTVDRFGGRPFVKRFTVCYRTVVCLCVCVSVCLSCITLVYCGQTVGWIKMRLGTEVGLGPGDIVLDGDPAPPTERGTAAAQFSAHVYCGQTVAHLSNC